MAKTKVAFFCSNCGHESSKWLGKCPGCGEWNTFQEEIITKSKSGSSNFRSGDINETQNKPLAIGRIENHTEERIDTGSAELNRTLGGGLVPGSLVLVGGEPGIGKSTLMLQISLHLKKHKILYVSGEESGQQLKMRAERIGIHNPDCFILTETRTQSILNHLKNMPVDMVVIDSIQTLQTEHLDSSPGSISQIRESAAEMLRFAKTSGIPVILIGHITKDGSLAGPKILEHMVDTVIHFEGDRNYGYRLLRATKNRFGSTSELGIFEMQSNGLREVSNPSEILLSQRDEQLSGIAIAATLEGMRPLLIEIQALVGTAAYGTPQRSTTGFDARRLNMLLAVLEKRSGFRLSSKDVFLNIAGGIRVDDPATDLAVIAAVLSSSEDMPVNHKSCFAAEVGLSGEIRPVNRIESRIGEAAKLGFEQIFISTYAKVDKEAFDIKIIPVSRVNQVFEHLFG